MKPKSSFAQGQRNLLKLAAILDTADAEHRKRGEPTYDQTIYEHECHTPACALGHWEKHKRRSGESFSDESFSDFYIDDQEHYDLFSFEGCNNAKTAKQAAKYIRAFVRRREKEA